MAEMEIDTLDEILSKAALDGSMDYSSWPSLLPTLIARIEKIAHTEFPIPNIPPPRPIARPPSPRFLAPLPPSDPAEAPGSPEDAQETNKENANPRSPSTARTATGGPGPASSNSTSTTLIDSSSSSNSSSSSTQQQQHSPPGPNPGAQPQPQQPATASPTPAALPKPVADMLGEVTDVLRANFAHRPPHTVQRLAELVLRPRRHYRGVVAYLHALDRVVHVTSGADTYPLPPAVPDVGALSLLAANGPGGGSGSSSNNNSSIGVGSDEALGGALLTPIPWLAARRANGRGGESEGDEGDEDEDGEGSESGSSSPPLGAVDLGPQSQPFAFQQQQQQQQQRLQAAGGGGGEGGRKLEGRVRTESTETIEGPNGMGSIETVSVSVNGIPSTGAGATVLGQRPVTQGELLRQEQKAGVAPRSQYGRQPQQQQQGQRQPSSGPATGGGAADEDTSMSDRPGEEGDRDEANAGAQSSGATSAGYVAAVAADGTATMRGIDVAAAVGRKSDSKARRASESPEHEIVPRSPKREAAEELEPVGSSRKRVRESDAGGTSSRPGQIKGQGQGQAKDKESKAAEQQQQQEEEEEESAGAEVDPEPRKDAEGDLVLVDDTIEKEPASTDPPPPAQGEGEAGDSARGSANADDKGERDEGKEKEQENSEAGEDGGSTAG